MPSPPLMSYTVVITGPSPTGIGGATALSLAKASPSKLLLLSRKQATIQPLIEQIATNYPETPVQYVECDLSSQRSVREAAAKIDELVPHINILINNAAVPPCPYSKTEDGIETQFAIDHVGHFLLTILLMPKILAARFGARIVNVSSSVHRYSTRLSITDYNFEDGNSYTEPKGYARAKAANILFTKSLAKKLKGHDVQAFSLHPGGIDTGMSAAVSKEAMEKARQERRDAAAREGREQKTPPPRKSIDQGCSTTLVAALDPSIADDSGAYLEDCKISLTPLPTHIESEEEAENLWELSEKLVGQRFDWTR